MGSRALNRRKYTFSISQQGCLWFNDQRLRCFPPDDFYFLNVVGLLVEKEQGGCGEKIRRRREKIVLKNLGRLWGNVVLPDERIKDNGARE